MNVRCLSVCLVLLVAGGLAAQDEPLAIEMVSGKVWQGRVVSMEDTSVEITTTGGATMKLPLQNLTMESRYRIRRSRADNDDAKSQMDLAFWCADHSLYMDARRHFRRAVDLDAALTPDINEKVAGYRTKAANEWLAQARQLQADGKPKEARRLLTRIVKELPLEDAAKDATALLADEHTEHLTAARKTVVAEHDDAVEAKLEPALKHYEKMLDETHKALLAGSKQGPAIKGFEAALKEGDRSKAALNGLFEGSREQLDGKLGAAVKGLEQKIADEMTQATIHLCDAYLMRGSYNDAADVVNKALANDPGNKDLQRAKGRVVAAQTDNDYGWGPIRVRAGGGGRGPR